MSSLHTEVHSIHFSKAAQYHFDGYTSNEPPTDRISRETLITEQSRAVALTFYKRLKAHRKQERSTLLNHEQRELTPLSIPYSDTGSRQREKKAFSAYE